MKKWLIILSRVIAILLVFWVGFSFGKSQTPAVPPEGLINPEMGKPDGVDFSLFWEAWDVLEKQFVDPARIDYQKMLFGAISGMAGSLKDPYTVFMPPEEARIFKEDVSGEFQGVGMEIGIKNNALIVIAPLEGTPADRAGLRAGDKIVKINGSSTDGMTTEEAVKLIRGQGGTEVVLNIFREGWKEPKEFRIVREVIEVPSLKWEMLASSGETGGKEGNTAYIKIYSFSEAAISSFRKAALEILDSQNRKIVLDLRNNPGGYLEVAQTIAGWFLENGQIVTVEDFGGKAENIEYKSKGPGSLASYPLVVLINQGSASASEILAGALRDNRGSLLIGEKSFGKGSVQELKELSEGSLKITVARWLTPNGDLIAEKGLNPDIEVKISEEDYGKDHDPQLDKALEILKELK